MFASALFRRHSRANLLGQKLVRDDVRDVPTLEIDARGGHGERVRRHGPRRCECSRCRLRSIGCFFAVATSEPPAADGRLDERVAGVRGEDDPPPCPVPVLAAAVARTRRRWWSPRRRRRASVAREFVEGVEGFLGRVVGGGCGEES